MPFKDFNEIKNIWLCSAAEEERNKKPPWFS